MISETDIIALSILSQESLFGAITSISHNDIIVKCNHGQGKFSFRIGQIKNGRIKIIFCEIRT
jgi:hypothetical protein